MTRVLVLVAIVLLLATGGAQPAPEGDGGPEELDVVAPASDWDDPTPWGGHVPGLSWEDPYTVDCAGRKACEQAVADSKESWTNATSRGDGEQVRP